MSHGRRTPVRFLLAAAALVAWLPATHAASAQFTLPGLEPPQEATEAPSTPKQPEAPASPSAIPTLTIPERAREVEAKLRAVRQAQDAPELDAIAVEMPSFLAAVSELARATELTVAGSRPRKLYDLLARWESLRVRLRDWNEQLKQRAAVIQELRQATQALRSTWQATLAALADESDVPRAAVAKSEQALRDLDQARDVLAAGAERLFELDERISHAEDTLEVNVEQVRSVLLRHDKRTFRRAGIPVWALPAAYDAGTLPPLRAHSESLSAGVQAFLSEYGDRLPLDLGVFAAFLLAAVLLARRAQKRATASGSELPEALRAPLAAAALVAFVAGGFVYFRAMFAVFDLLSLGALACLFWLVPRLVRHRELTPPLRVFTAWLALHRVFLLLSLDSPWHELAMMLVGALLSATAFWMWRTRPSLTVDASSSALERGLALGIRLAALGLSTALIAGLFGYHALLLFLTEGVTASAFWLLLSVAITRALHGFIFALLESERLRGLLSMQQHGELVRRRALRFANMLGVVLWCAITLYAFGLMAPLVKSAGEILGHRAVVGTWSVSLGDVARFALTMYGATLVARITSFLLEQDVLPRMNLARGVPATISRLTGYVLLTLGFLLAVGAAGVDMSRIALVASALSVGVGFGLQNVVNNFVSGLMLIFERPVRVGDVIQLDDLTGEVRSIGIRSSTVRTYQGAEVIVPNANLISNQVINWTLSDLKRRIEIPLSVSQQSNPDEVIELVQNAVAEVAEIERSPAPTAILTHIREDSLDFELWVWVRRADDWPNVRSAALRAVHKKLEGTTIEIAVPQCDVNLRSIDPAAAQQLAAQHTKPLELPAAHETAQP